MSQEQMIHDDRPVLQIIAFSDLIPNTLTGDIFAEIRMAYLLDGSKKIPVTGGAVSGNVFEMFRKVHFSKEPVIHDHYYGPVATRFDDLQVTGK